MNNDLIALSKELKEITFHCQLRKIMAILNFLREKGITIFCKGETVFTDGSGYHLSAIVEVSRELMAKQIYDKGIRAENLLAAIKTKYKQDRIKTKILQMIPQSKPES